MDSLLTLLQSLLLPGKYLYHILTFLVDILYTDMDAIWESATIQPLWIECRKVLIHSTLISTKAAFYMVEHLDCQHCTMFLTSLTGVNTGFGGSADTRTTDLLALQRALMQLTQTAVITKEDKSAAPARQEYLQSHSMPSSWTRAMILVRCNANIRGHSAMTAITLNAMIKLIEHDIIPVIPLRGSISASGDLMPLSYMSGAIQGSPDIFVRVGGRIGPPAVKPAKEALEEAGIQPVVLGPKEGLSLINGTAAATAVATLGLFEANQLAVLSQFLTALTSEALYANVEWAHPFIAAVRPHDGQIEAAQNARFLLRGSQLTYGLETAKNRFKAGLAQERYALRSSPQWLSPQLEDLLSAEKQLTTELNSSSDNPVVNARDDDIHGGANFQASAVTSATEKIRLAMYAIGRMLFSQTTETINHDLSNGLPPNLAADDPSLSFCLKGLDVNIAAYVSELGFLANPVSNHVQSAEMSNQAINSLALLSARKTLEAIETVSLIAASALYTACQGVDLRTMHRTFLLGLEDTTKHFLQGILLDADLLEVLFPVFWKLFEASWYKNCTFDAIERCDKASHSLSTAFLQCVKQPGLFDIQHVAGLQHTLQALVLDSYLKHRETFFGDPPTADYLGAGTKVIYLYVRRTLGVPMHRGLIEHPLTDEVNLIDGRFKKTIGSWVSIIYEAIRDGSLVGVLLEYLQSSGAADGDFTKSAINEVPRNSTVPSN